MAAAAKQKKAYEVMELPLTQIAPDVYQARRSGNGSHQEIKQSIEENGQRTPIVVAEAHPSENHGKKYVIVGGGNTRYKIAQELKWRTIACQIIPHPGVLGAILSSMNENNARESVPFADNAQEVGNAYSVWVQEGAQSKRPGKKPNVADFARLVKDRACVGQTMIYLAVNLHTIFEGEIPPQITKNQAMDVDKAHRRMEGVFMSLFGKDHGVLPDRNLFAEIFEKNSVYLNVVELAKKSGKLRDAANKLAEKLGQDEMSDLLEKYEKLSPGHGKNALADNILRAVRDHVYEHYHGREDLPKPGSLVMSVRKDMEHDIARLRREKKDDSRPSAAPSASKGQPPAAAKPPAKKTVKLQVLSMEPLARLGAPRLSAKVQMDLPRGISQALSEIFKDKQERNAYEKRRKLCARALPALFGAMAPLSEKDFTAAARWFEVTHHYSYHSGSWFNKEENLLWHCLFSDGHNEFTEWLLRCTTGCDLKLGDDATYAALQLLFGDTSDWGKPGDVRMWRAAGVARIKMRLQELMDVEEDIAIIAFVEKDSGKIYWNAGLQGKEIGGYYLARMQTAGSGLVSDPRKQFETPMEAVLELFRNGMKYSHRVGGNDPDQYIVRETGDEKISSIMDNIRLGKGAMSTYLTSLDEQYKKWAKK